MNHPYMPFYVAEYLGDTGHLNTTQHGAYLLLILHYWRKGGLPNDDRQLANITKLPLRIWQDIRPIIQDFFFDEWRHKRVEFELTEVERKLANAKRAGLASGKSRRSSNDRSTTVEQPLNDRPNRTPTPIDSERSIEASASILAAKKSRRQSKAPLPSDFRLSEQDIEFAMSKGWTQAYLQSEFSRFCDHAMANARQQANWQAAWRNWVTSPFQKSGSGMKNGQVSPLIAAADDLVERTRRHLAEFRGEGQFCDGEGAPPPWSVSTRRGE